MSIEIHIIIANCSLSSASFRASATDGDRTVNKDEEAAKRHLPPPKQHWAFLCLQSRAAVSRNAAALSLAELRGV